MTKKNEFEDMVEWAFVYSKCKDKDCIKVNRVPILLITDPSEELLKKLHLKTKIRGGR